jgi:hypothetical protein
MTQTPQTPAASLQLDQELAKRAYQKLMAGQQPTAEEKAALRRFEKDKEESRRWEYYRSIPQKHWRQMSGRPTQVINSQAERYGIPFGGAKIDLTKVVKALHEFLAVNAQKLASDDELMQGDASSPALERYREERARLAQLDRLEREHVLVQRDQVREGLGRIASIIRTAGDTLQRQFGPDAAEILLDSLDDAEQEIERLFGNGNVRAEPTNEHAD